MGWFFWRTEGLGDGLLLHHLLANNVMTYDAVQAHPSLTFFCFLMMPSGIPHIAVSFSLWWWTFIFSLIYIATHTLLLYVTPLTILNLTNNHPVNPPITIPWGSTMHFLIHFKTHLLNKINGIYGREGRVVESGEIETRKSVHPKVWFGSGLPSGPVGLKCLKSHLKSSHLKTEARKPWPQKTLPSLP